MAGRIWDAAERCGRFVVGRLVLRGRRREDSPDRGLPDWTPLESENEYAYNVSNRAMTLEELTQIPAGAGTGKNAEPEKPRMSEENRRLCKVVGEKIKMASRAHEMENNFKYERYKLNQANCTIAELEQRLGSMSLELVDTKSANADLTQQLEQKSEELAQALSTIKDLERQLAIRSETIRKVPGQLTPSRAEDGGSLKRKHPGDLLTDGEAPKRLRLTKSEVAQESELELSPPVRRKTGMPTKMKSSRASHFSLKSWQVSNDTAPSRK